MEYVQKLQQLNKMSREFRRFALSAYADDALRDAEEVYGSARVVIEAPKKVSSTFTEMVASAPLTRITAAICDRLSNRSPESATAM